MAFCPNFNTFSKFVRAIKQSVLIDKDKDKDLRYDVWSTTQEHVATLFKKGVDALPGGRNNSSHVMSKVESALLRIKASPKSASKFVTDIIEDDENIAYSIALHELMESVKGESDKARNLGIDVVSISNTGVLPALPMSRVAASIGRKIAFQQGFRFKSDKTDKKTPAEIETLYYAVGNRALLALEKKGYVVMRDNLGTIKDYITSDEMNVEFPEINVITKNALSVSLNERKFGIKAGTTEAAYFLKRTDSDIAGTKLGVIADMLGAVRQITQPSTIVMPDKAPTKTMEELAEGDDQNIAPDEKTEKIRKKLYDTPVYVHNTIHELMTLLNEESVKTGKSGSKIIKEGFSGHPTLINSLFGLKRSDDYSIDKKESVAGQNLSKTTPLDDLVEHYKIIQGDNTGPAPLHMALKIGRNARLYYENSVLNPHGSKQSRYMLTAGKYTVDSKGDDFDYLVYTISQALGDDTLTYKDFTEAGDSKLDKALDILDKYNASNNIDSKLASLSKMSAKFPGTDYVTLLTTLEAVKDIRNPVAGKVTTEFSASADATASGGTLTFLQALGTNPEVEEFLKRISLLKGGDPDNAIDDLYGIMTEAIRKFVAGEDIELLIEDENTDSRRSIIGETVALLFGEKDSDVRELSKDPTMTFVYSQGKKGATETMARSLADRIIDNLDDKKVRDYLANLFNDNSYKKVNSGKLKDTTGLYDSIVVQLADAGIPGQLYDLMDASINKQYLKNFKIRSNKVDAFVKKLPTDKPFKILPAGAKMSGAKPVIEDIDKFGMPLTKVMEVSNPTMPGQPDTVLTRRQKRTKTVADVSPIHSIDAAQLYHSLDAIMSKFGVVVVHDDVRGTVQDVRAMEEEYREQTIEIISEYDIHQAIMNSVAAYSPEIAQSTEFKELMAEIQEDVDNKKKIMESSFNHETHALIGDGMAYREFAGNPDRSTPERAAKPKTAPEPAKDTVEETGEDAPVTETKAATKETAQAEAEPETKTQVEVEVKQEAKPGNAKKERVKKAEEKPTSKAEKAKVEEDYHKAYEDKFQGKERAGTVSYLNNAVSAMLTSKLERKGRTLFGNLHNSILPDLFPVYTDVADKIRGVYKGSEAMQQLMHTITGNGIDKLKKADVLSKFAMVMGNQKEVINIQMAKFHHELAGMTDKEKKTIGRFVTDMPLHDYFVLASKFKTEGAIATEVKRLEKAVRNDALKDVNDLIAWNVKHDENSRGRIYNLDAKYPMDGSDFGEDVRKLLVLKSIQEIGTGDFIKLLENTDLINLIKDTSVANRLSLLENEGSSKLPDSMLKDYYKEPFRIKAIELNELTMYDTGEATGWEVLRAPTKDYLGVVYKKTIDSSSIPGAYTDTKLLSADIEVTGKKAEYPGVVNTADGKKLRLSREDKLKLGLVEDFTQALVHGTAHNIAINDSQIIRDELLKSETRMIVGSNTGKLESVIDSDNIDNPWFVKLKEGMTYNELPKSVKANYMRIGKRASNVKGFNDNVDLVRKDISHWLMGASAKSLVTHPQAKWAMRIVKNMVAGAKIGMVVLNPMKIVQDNVSNVVYLGTMGVSQLYIAKNYKEIAVDYQEYAELRRKILQLKVQLTARPKSPKLKKQIKTLQKRLARNPLGDLGDKGFINSLGSDLVAKNADTLSGLQADMHTALDYLLINKDGKKNYVSHFILQLQNLGFNGEDFLSYIGNLAHKAGAEKDVQKELDLVAERLKEIRTEQDVINYVSQYTTSPSSEAVRMGSSMTDLTDVLAKETLYRHLVENEGASPEAARIKVLDSFPDYKENMPLIVKQLSDVGIIMFPSFWLRIQKVIYRLGRDKPVNLATELMLEEVMGQNINTIVDANIINKSNTFGGIFHTPLEPIGLGSVFPTHLW